MGGVLFLFEQLQWQGIGHCIRILVTILACGGGKESPLDRDNGENETKVVWEAAFSVVTCGLFKWRELEIRLVILGAHVKTLNNISRFFSSVKLLKIFEQSL